MQHPIQHKELPNLQRQLHQGVESVGLALAQLSCPRTQSTLLAIASTICDCFQRGGKLLIAGNGGSLCDAMHMAEELTGYFRRRRPGLPALALADPGHLTCVANDAGFEQVFARGVQALGKSEDIFVGLSTSGESLNLVRAFAAAKQQGLKTLSFLGNGGGALLQVADLEFLVDGHLHSDRIQEVHMTAIHLIIELCETLLFSSH